MAEFTQHNKDVEQCHQPRFTLLCRSGSPWQRNIKARASLRACIIVCVEGVSYSPLICSSERTVCLHFYQRTGRLRAAEDDRLLVEKKGKRCLTGVFVYICLTTLFSRIVYDEREREDVSLSSVSSLKPVQHPGSRQDFNQC